VTDRPHLATLFSIAVFSAAAVHLSISYLVSTRSRTVIHTTVKKEVAKGGSTTTPRPKEPIDVALRKNDVGKVKEHMSWCRKYGDCDLDKDLHLAAASSDPAITRVLLAAGAKVDAPDATRQTALHAAATGGRSGIAQVLVQAGANVNARDEEGRTPLYTAAAWGHLELMRVLLSAGADANAADLRKQTPLHVVAGRRVPPLAVYADVTRVLLNAGARPNARAADGSTPLHRARLAASQLSLEGNLKATGDANEVVALLRERGGHE